MTTTSKSGLTDKFRPPATKVCRLCNQELPIKDFARNVRGRSGYANECRACNWKHEHQKIEEQKEKAKTFFDAKFFTLALLLTTSTAFSQSIPVEKMAPNTYQFIKGMNGDGDTLRYNIVIKSTITPDTSRAILLVTLSPNGIAHARMGYVVIEQGKPPVYLDCRKQALKWPQVGWDWREVGVNYKQK